MATKQSVLINRIDQLREVVQPEEQVFLVMGKDAPAPPEAVQAEAAGARVMVVRIVPVKAHNGKPVEEEIGL